MLDLTVRDVFERYGPTLAVIAALAILVALVPGSGSDDGDLVAATEGPTAAPDGQVAGDPSTGTPTGSVGARGAAAGPTAAPADSTVGPRAAGDGPLAAASAAPEGVDCREDGRMHGFSFYQPACKPEFSGSNGGSTWQGVSDDTVRVVRFLGNPNPIESATLQALGADDSEEVRNRVDRSLVHYFNNHVETFGREVVVHTYQGTGGADNDEAARADAAQLIDDFDPFAVFGATPTGINDEILGEELAARGVMCFCGSTQTRAYMNRNAPYVWTSLPQYDEYMIQLAEYWGKRLAGSEAKWADPSTPPVDYSQRKFGLIYIEGSGDRVDPDVAPVIAMFEDELAKYGVPLAKKVGYTLDLARGQEQAINIMAQMKSEGVTTIACMCDPLTPVFFYEEATRSTYFPEHTVVGSLLMDTTFFGRTYDKAQWQNAFGISPLWVFFEDVSTSSGYRAYHHGDPGRARGDEGVQINVRQAPIQLLMNGIHYAGPNLTPETFEQGFFNADPSGGVPKAPLVYFNENSHTAIKDFTEVWWNPQQSGRDETGKEGAGGLMKSNGGQRYEPGTWPVLDQPTVFELDPNPVFTTDEPPETYDHDADGHDHGRWNDPDHQACRSCNRTSDRT